MRLTIGLVFDTFVCDNGGLHVRCKSFPITLFKFYFPFVLLEF